MGHSITMLEQFEVCSTDQLNVCTTVKGKEKLVIHIEVEADLDVLKRSVDPKTLRLTKEIQLAGTHLVRGGLLSRDEPIEHQADLLNNLHAPCVVNFRYEDMSSTTTFNREGERPRVVTSAIKHPDVRGVTKAEDPVRLQRKSAGCSFGPVSLIK